MFFEHLARLATRRRARAALPQDLGARGERAAADFLRNLGYRVVAANWRCRLGEIDLICRDGDVLVFVEVKARAGEDDATPEEQVHAFKQRQVIRAAGVYLKRFDEASMPIVRFDVVAVVWPAGGKPTIRHHADAFAAG